MNGLLFAILPRPSGGDLPLDPRDTVPALPLAPAPMTVFGGGSPEKPKAPVEQALKPLGKQGATTMIRILPLLLLLAAAPATPQDNALTEEERQAGWRLLFDGRTTEGWRGYKKKEMPPGWKVLDGALVRVAGGAGGKGAGGGDDILTVEQFDNFDLKLEWKIVDRAGNSGIIIRASEDAVASWHTGPEMQVLDNAAYPGRDPRQRAGACYDLYAPVQDASRPRGEWNAVRILADGNHIEHWLNGEKIVEYELGSEDWKERVARSKFKDMRFFKEPPAKGHLCLQDHTARIEYRRLKIRPLPAKAQKP